MNIKTTCNNSAFSFYFRNNLNKLTFSQLFNNSHNKINKNLLLSNQYMFSRIRQQSSDQILKEYFSSRLTLSSTQLKNYMISLSRNSDVKIKDHRWQNLYMTIEKYHKDFQLNSKIQIIHALGKMKQNNSLFLVLYKDILSEFHQLNLSQISILLWSMVKVQQTDKNVVTSIYKKLYKILQNNQNIKLTKKNQTLNSKQEEYRKYDDEIQENNNNEKQQIFLSQANFTLLIWSLQRSKIIDEKLILNLLKHVFQDQTNLNLQKLRIQNLCLLLYCMVQLNFQKYRLIQTIINKIMNDWRDIENISILTLVVLLDSFRKCIINKQKYILKYANEINQQKKLHKEESLNNQKNFCLLVTQTILLRHQNDVKRSKMYKKRKIKNQQFEIKKLQVTLSSKFASQIIFNLGMLNLYVKEIYFKVLYCITDNVDQAQTQDLTMTLSGLCNLKITNITSEQKSQIIYQHKKIICRRLFQIYTSLKGKSLNIIKDLIHEKKIQNQFVPSRVRKQIEQEYALRKIQEENKKNQQKSDENKQT